MLLMQIKGEHSTGEVTSLLNTAPPMVQKLRNLVFSGSTYTGTERGSCLTKLQKDDQQPL